MSVHSNTVKTIAKLITEDPQIINEFRGPPSGSHTAEEVPLTPDYSVFGDVSYEFTLGSSGDYVPASRFEPASMPEVAVESVDDVTILRAYTEDGQEVPVRPEFVKVATDYFWKKLAKEAAQRSLE